MIRNLFFISVAFFLFSSGYGQTVTFLTDDGLTTKTICKGTEIQLNLDINPPTPRGVGSTYNVQWEKTTNPTFIRNCPFPSPGGTCSFFRDIPQATTTYTVIVNGGPGGSVRKSITMTVDEVPNPGINTTMFLCGKTGVINLFDELDGGPDSGGTWSNSTGTYDTSNSNGGAFTYTINGGGACPPVSAVITVKPCGDNDSDNDGVPNIIDNDKDNDGIPNSVEDGFCTAATTTPIFVLEEDFGFGAPTRSRYSEGLGLTYNPLLPQDLSNDGEYNVATSTHYRTNVGFDAIFLATDLIGDIDANGDKDGRYLAINMKSSRFANKPVFVAKDLPVTPGLEYDFSMSIASLNNNTFEKPANLTIEVVDQATNTAIFSQNSGEILNGTDNWILVQSSFIPSLAVNVVTIRVINNQNVDGNGNDIGIDNVFLSTAACDFDRDGIPNSEDLDADNDGIYDIVETGNAAFDTNGDGRFDGGINTDGTSTIVTHNVINSDTDANQNFLDIDSDGDGIIDNIESQTTGGYLAPSSIDGNFNGVDDVYDNNVITPTDTNNNNIPDYLDLNSDLPSDGDCLNDMVEAYDVNEDGIADIVPANSDADGDGLDDNYDKITLNRLSGITNPTNGGTLPISFPDNHSPGNDRDWREAFELIDEKITKISLCGSANTINLFDELPTSTAITGTWRVPVGASSLTGGHLGTLDPSSSGAISGDYIYALPLIGTCPERKYTIPVEITPEPFPGIDDMVMVCTSDASFTLISKLKPGVGGKVADTNGTWTDPNNMPFGTDANAIFNPAIDIIGDYTYTISVPGCSVVSAKVTISVRGSNAGTAPVAIQDFCRLGTTLIDLFSLLTDNPDTGGTWEMPSGSVFNGTIQPSDVLFTTGDYKYTVTSTGGCPPAESIIKVRINELPVLSNIQPLCATDRLTYDISYDISGAGTVTANNGTVDSVGKKITGITVGQDVIITLTSATDASCTNTITVTSPNCTCPVIAPPTNPSDLTMCKGTTIPALSVTLELNQEGRWYLADGITPIARAQNTETFTPSIAELVDGLNTFKVVAFDTVEQCISTQVTVNLTVVKATEVILPTTNEGCESFTLPALSIGDYFSASNGGGTKYAVGDSFTVDTSFFIYEETVVNGVVCSDEKTYNVVINKAPVLSNIQPSCATDRLTYDISYDISGAGTVTANNGTVDPVGKKITGITVGQDVIITLTSATDASCTNTITVTSPNCTCPVIAPPTNPSDLTMCKGSTIPALSVTLEANQEGRWYLADGITSISTAQNTDTFTPSVAELVDGLNMFKVVAFDTVEQCISSQVTVSLTVVKAAEVILPTTNEGCGVFILPALSVGDYFSRPNKGGVKYSAGTIFIKNTSLFIYTETIVNGVMCLDEKPYNVVVNPVPIPVPPVLLSSYCESFVLPTLTNRNQEYIRRVGTMDIPIASGTEIKTSETLFVIETVNGCKGETSFDIVIDTNSGDPGIDGELVFCKNDSPKSLFTGLSGTPTQNGTWKTPSGVDFGTDFNAQIDPNVDLPGDYIYTIPVNGNCPSKSTVVSVIINTIPQPTAPILEASYCESFVLPALTNSNQWYVERTGSGDIIIPEGTDITSTQTLFIKESLNGCEGEVSFDITIEKLPTVTLSPLESFCVDENGSPISTGNTISFSGITNLQDYEYTWLLNNAILNGETDSVLDIKEAGEYTLLFSSKNTPSCSSQTQSIIVTANMLPTITSIEAEDHTISIVGEGENIEYEITGVVTQTTGVFTNLPYGEYSGEVINECGSVPFGPINLFGFPKFFTPNNDGYQDQWNVIGYNHNDMVIMIYNRYGKLIVSFTALTSGWDGIYNNSKMPADDYWYVAKKNDGLIFKGHFSLVR